MWGCAAVVEVVIFLVVVMGMVVGLVLVVVLLVAGMGVVVLVVTMVGLIVAFWGGGWCRRGSRTEIRVDAFLWLVLFDGGGVGLFLLGCDGVGVGDGGGVGVGVRAGVRVGVGVGV